MRRVFRSAAVALAFICASLVAQDKQPGNVAPYYPSPLPVVKQMLELGELKAGQLHYDLGSGDGRLVIAAARDFGARSVGFEIDQQLVDASRQQIADLDIGGLASIESRYLFAADFSKPDLITVYLLPKALERLRPLLEEQMKPGSIVISHDFMVPGWKASKTIMIDEELEIDGLLHSIYIYRR